jgi:hypothetical protein
MVPKYLGMLYNQIDHIYTVENNDNYKVIYQAELIKDLNLITKEEENRFNSELDKLKICSGNIDQGLKRLDKAVPCFGRINQQDFTGFITYELKLHCFAHRILFLSISPEAGCVAKPVLLLACILRHGTEHDRPFPSFYQLADIDLPQKVLTASDPALAQPSTSYPLANKP